MRLSFAYSFDARKSLHIQHIRPVNPHKAPGVERGLDIGERLLF